MSNLSELLPSGGGQNVVSMTASGAISAGQAVILNSDGTVSAISAESATQGKGSTVLFESGGTSECDVVYDTYNNKIVIAYRDHDDSNAGKCVVGTVSGDSISFGTPVSFESSNSVDEMAIAYDSTNYKVLIAYNDQTNNVGKAIVGTVSGDSISFGSASQFNAATTNYPNVVYVADEGKYVITYQDSGNSSYGTAVVVTVSGTTISYSSDLVFRSSEARYIDSCVQTAANDTSGQSRPRVVVVYSRLHSGNHKPHAQALTFISGTLYTGPENTLSSSNRGDQFAVEADPVNNRYLTVFRDEDNSDKMGAMSFGLSEDSITTKSSIVEVHGGTSTDYRIVYDANAAKLTVFYRDNSNSSLLTAILCSDVSQSGLAFSSELVLNSSISTHLGAAYDEDTKQIVVVYRDNSASPVDGGRAVVYTNTYSSTNLTSTNCIGIAAGAISNSAAGDVNVFGGINTKQSGLTIGSDYYVQSNGAITTTSDSPAVLLGQAISTTTINMRNLT